MKVDFSHFYDGESKFLCPFALPLPNSHSVLSQDSLFATELSWERYAAWLETRFEAYWVEKSSGV